MKVTRRKFRRTGLLATLGAILVDMFWFEKFLIKGIPKKLFLDKNGALKYIEGNYPLGKDSASSGYR